MAHLCQWITRKKDFDGLPSSLNATKMSEYIETTPRSSDFIWAQLSNDRQNGEIEFACINLAKTALLETNANKSARLQYTPVLS